MMHFYNNKNQDDFILKIKKYTLKGLSLNNMNQRKNKAWKGKDK